jgi:hypothetical protein
MAQSKSVSPAVAGVPIAEFGLRNEKATCLFFNPQSEIYNPQSARLGVFA